MSGGFGSAARLDTLAGRVNYFRLGRLGELGLGDLDRLPYSLRVLLEGALRHAEQDGDAESDVVALVRPAEIASEVAFRPRRVLHQDFTGGAAMVDLAAMRAALQRLGGDPQRINPVVPTDFVIDHSVQAEFSGIPEAFDLNVELEIAQNRERYLFLRWAQQAFQNFRLVPPGTGIIHQVNLEHLATVVQANRTADGEWIAMPDSLVGTDSHTTMINGLGVLGWGVGGIEAEAAMLGIPLYLLVPEVVGVRLHGKLNPGVTATDLVLSVTALLREHGVVGKFVEFCGPGVDALALADRATVANMAPEYGASLGFFPVDDETLGYLQTTGRDPRQVDLVERYTKAQGLFRTATAPLPTFGDLLEFDLAGVETSLAGPRHPHDRLPLREVRRSFTAALASQHTPARRLSIQVDGEGVELGDGAVVIAAITSCTNTSNPALMIAAGLLARNAVERGMRVPRYVKTSLAPGSAVVADYLARAGLTPYLDTLGFQVVGFGCTTCAGGSGTLAAPVAAGVGDHDLLVAAVLSGNRNFEGRIHPQCRLAYLGSPPLVIAYALAGTVDIDLDSEPLGTDAAGQPVHLREVWPTDAEVQRTLTRTLDPNLFKARYAHVFDGDARWHALAPMSGPLFDWQPDSTYIREPGYFRDFEAAPVPLTAILGGRALVVLGDSVSTDHISPAGAIPRDSPAGRYLVERGVRPSEFNSYGARRGNHEVMVRGTFANIRLRNALVPEHEGGWTKHLPSGQVLSVFEAAELYQAEGRPLFILAGRNYGAGSSRDWAAKGPALLGVRAVLAESFERIHRSNLIGMGVLPLQYLPGENRVALGLNGEELFDVLGLEDGLLPGQRLTVQAQCADSALRRFEVIARVDSPVEVEYYRHGGILPFMVRKLLTERPGGR